ncbi:MAG: hypothetical protein HC903_28535 [Methylacidiphilales bacterium]|nr:hypothetical protein [Candidatus Methylacidiphilales bacterium]NJR17151.1 hypothetical protein [Calothrix sp. CSU_2_0]
MNLNRAQIYLLMAGLLALQQREGLYSVASQDADDLFDQLNELLNAIAPTVQS